MRRIVTCLLAVVALSGAGAANSAQYWTQGQNYFLLQPAQPTSVGPGKIEVTEVFSYACPACNRFYPIVDKLKAALPANAEMTFVPAAFNQAEDWPMFQRAFFAAQSMGIDRKTHDAMFDAVWKTGELAVVEPGTDRLRSPAPKIEDAARWYAKTAGINADTFVTTANSFGVDTKTRQADQYIRAAQVDQTPTIIVNGKYRVTVGSAGGDDKIIDLVLYLVTQEGGTPAKGAAH
ncbi:MAG TPA: thiol:disulfide interchange protein DsbA/DsbL [Steroidobacteraceae bacterium]|nr:thiol:disulfide interchange protein DsbA/DsbL [Steroidobacteraceae bacterium]